MPRPVYYQSPGNPIQLQRVPSQPLELEFAYRSRTVEDDKQFFGQVMYETVLIGITATVLCWILSAWITFDPVALLVAVLVVALFLQFCRVRMQAISAASLWLLLIACLIGLLPVPAIVTVFIMLVATILFGRELTRLFTFVATVSPTPLEKAWAIRNAMSWQTAVASFAILPLGFAFLVPAFLRECLIVCGCTLVLSWGAFVESQRRYRQAFADAVVLWCCYNRDDAPIPGTLGSPSGTLQTRLGLLSSVVLVNVCGLGSLLFSPANRFMDDFMRLVSEDGIAGLIAFLIIATLTAIGLTLAAIVWVAAATAIVGMPAFGKLTRPNSLVPADEWKYVTDRLRRSENNVEHNSLYMGRVSQDQSPLIVPRKVFQEHAHILGDSGSGKTARGLTPFVEQIMSTGQASGMLIDMKGDSHELFEAGREGAKAAKLLYGVEVSVGYLNDRPDEPTFAFNPFQLRAWGKLTDLQKTDVLCGGLGLIYGSDYGEGYYSSANASVLYATIRHFPDVGSFRELAEKIKYVLARPKAHGLDTKARDAGNHVLMVVTRLATIPALNVTKSHTPDIEVFDDMLDPSRLFERPELHYFNLSSTLGPGSSPEIARLAIFMLMISATLMKKRQVHVYLIIDEFQRIAARNLDYLLQLARSMNVAVILANQSIQDLRRYDLVPVLETNCRYRQWFSVSGWEDQDRLSHHSGETVDVLHTKSFSTSTNDKGTSTSRSSSSQQFIGPRLTQNDIKLISDDDQKSIVLITRGDGYAQYGGMPVVVETDFHISNDEYQARKDAEWPAGPGTFVPQDWTGFENPNGGSGSQGAIVTHEEVGEDLDEERGNRSKRKPRKRRRGQSTSKPDERGASDIFDAYLRDHPIVPDEVASSVSDGKASHDGEGHADDR
ncbi:MAG: TraM recognition domain-containing protein [Planctomycetales bacterium]|nr:TraM recognition domain-containing protein [Planctomycetales bacterium]